MKRAARTGLALVAAALLIGLSREPDVAAAPPVPVVPMQATPSTASKACVVAGTTPVPADTMIFDQRKGGQAIAKLTGPSLPLRITEFPDPFQGRLALETSRGAKALRIEGWVDSAKLRLFARRDIPLVGRHVWLTKGMPVTVKRARAMGFEIEHDILGSDQKLSATAPCGAVQLEFPTITSPAPPRRARTYQMKKAQLELFDGPGGDRVFTLKMEEDTRKVFWSTELRGGYVHVLSRADVTIDAWARASDLTYLHHAELFDLEAIAPKPLSSPTLALQDAPTPLVAIKALPIHRKAENGEPIGEVETGADFYPMEQSGDWTNIMPVGLAVLPPDDGGFWVRTAGLPKKDREKSVSSMSLRRKDWW